MDKKAFLELRIEFPHGTIHMKSDIGEVDMIPFTGTVSGDIFNGVVEPGGVDVQTVDQVHMRHMYARYMLTGTDKEGKTAHIYVENEAWIPDIGRQLPFHTVPRFMTDSKALAPYLHQNRFEGRVEKEDGKIVIRFYDLY